MTSFFNRVRASNNRVSKYLIKSFFALQLDESFIERAVLLGGEVETVSGFAGVHNLEEVGVDS